MISVDTLEDNKAFALKEHADFRCSRTRTRRSRSLSGDFARHTARAPVRQALDVLHRSTGKIAFIDKAVKPATSGQDIVAKLGELNVPKRK
jgi:hypothetical protein